jgi:hypothetical protein
MALSAVRFHDFAVAEVGPPPPLRCALSRTGTGSEVESQTATVIKQNASHTP